MTHLSSTLPFDYGLALYLLLLQTVNDQRDRRSNSLKDRLQNPAKLPVIPLKLPGLSSHRASPIRNHAKCTTMRRNWAPGVPIASLQEGFTHYLKADQQE